MTDDDLIALAKKATPGPWVIIPPTPHEDEEGCFTHPGGIEGSDGNPVCVFGDPSGSGTMFENEVNPSYIAAANPAAIIALIERHRAEVAALEKWRDDALETFYNICVKALGWTDPRTHHSDIPPPEWTQGKISDGVKAEMDKLRAEVERLTRENNNLSAGQKHALESCWAAEAALAAAQKTLAEIEIMARPTDTPNEALDNIRALALTGPSALAKYTYPPEEVGDDISVQLAVELSEAYTALAAERERCGELEEALEEIASNVTSLGDALDTACNALRRKRAALAGKDAPDKHEATGA